MNAFSAPTGERVNTCTNAKITQLTLVHPIAQQQTCLHTRRVKETGIYLGLGYYLKFYGIKMRLK